MSLRVFVFVLSLCCAACAQPCGDEAQFRKRFDEKEAQRRQYWQAKQFGKAAGVLEELRRDACFAQFPEYQSGVLYNLACAYSLAGQKQQAVAALKESARAGNSNYRHAEKDTDLDSIRQEPGYEEAVARMRALAGFWDGPPIVTSYREELSEEEKIAGLSKFWAEVKYNFAWFDNVPDLNWDAAFLAYLPKVRQTKTTLGYYRLLQEMCALLKDGHTYITPPGPVRDQLDWRPALRSGLVGGKVLVLEVSDDSLKQDGIRPGLEMAEVEGVPVREHAERTVRPYQSASTAHALEHSTYGLALLAGAKGSSVNVAFEDDRGQRFQRSLARSTQRRNPPRPPLEFEVLPGSIGYLALNSFNEERVVRDFESVWASIEKTDGLIIDLRANPGGNEGYGRPILACLFDRPFQTTIRGTRRNRAYFRAQGEVMDWHIWPQQILRPRGTQFYSNPVLVLTSARTGSAAEDFLSTLVIEKRATIVGEPTAGSTGQPLFVALPGGGGAGICTSKSWYPDRTTFVGVGIQPHLRVSPTIAGVRAGRDEVLEAALEHLRKLWSGG